jgi:CheY-like chemotaxis protein
MTSNSLVGKSGIEVLRELRANDRFRELPIIMYSGDRLGRIEYEAEQLKAVYLDKAFYSMSDAMDKLKEIKL